MPSWSNHRNAESVLAGVEGFEPPNGGIKTRCLTTWRHPSSLHSILTRSATSHAAANGSVRARRNCSNDPEPAPRRAPHPRRARSPRRCTRRCPSYAPRSARRAHRSARTASPAPAATSAWRARTTGSNTLPVPPSEKARIVMRGEFRVNSGAWNISRGAHRHPGMNHQKPALRQLHGTQPLAAALPPGGTAHEQTPARPRPVPAPAAPAHPLPDRVPHSAIQRQQYRRRIRAAAPQPAADRNMFERPGCRPLASRRCAAAAPERHVPPGPARARRRPGRALRVMRPSARTARPIRSQRSIS